MARDFDYYFNVVISGDCGVGKTSLKTRYTDDSFSETYTATIGVEFVSKIIPLDGKYVKLAIWDTAGHERYQAIVNSYYRGAHGVFIVYDVTKQKSFETIHQLVEEADKWTSGDVSKLLIGNKCDLMGDRVVNYHTAKNFADQLGMSYIETSAKDAANVEQAFVMIAADMVEKNEQSKAEYNKDRVQLNKSETAQNKLCC